MIIRREPQGVKDLKWEVTPNTINTFLSYYLVLVNQNILWTTYIISNVLVVTFLKDEMSFNHEIYLTENIIPTSTQYT